MTDDKIKTFVAAIEATRQAEEAEEIAHTQACWAPLPKNLRPAKASDIVEGAIIWYPHRRDDLPLEQLSPPNADEAGEARAWEFVAEVYKPNDDWKAYSSYEGCRYGLRGAFVEAQGGKQ